MRRRSSGSAPSGEQCFFDVLIKISGDPRLRDNPAIASAAEGAGSFVQAVGYRDRLEGRPIRDEQGARDRPHDLTVKFDDAAIDGLLRSVGSRPWGAERPRLAVFVAVRQGLSAYTLSEDGERGFGQRAALQAASGRVGVPVVLARRSDFQAASPDVGPISTSDLARADQISRRIGADLPLLGEMTFSDEEHGWVTEWRLRAGGRVYHWRVRGVNFDEAFRNGLFGAAQVLSGNGEPGRE